MQPAMIVERQPVNDFIHGLPARLEAPAVDARE
jgi:hypothetical protein